MKLILEGVYNHGEVIWLETKWLLLWLFRAYIYKQSLGSNHVLDDWVEIMPKHNLLRYCNWQGSVAYRYTVPVGVSMDGRDLMLQLKGWKCKTDVVPADVAVAIKTANEQLFYKELDKAIS